MTTDDAHDDIPVVVKPKRSKGKKRKVEEVNPFAVMMSAAQTACHLDGDGPIKYSIFNSKKQQDSTFTMAASAIPSLPPLQSRRIPLFPLIPHVGAYAQKRREYVFPERPEKTGELYTYHLVASKKPGLFAASSLQPGPSYQNSQDIWWTNKLRQTFKVYYDGAPLTVQTPWGRITKHETKTFEASKNKPAASIDKYGLQFDMEKPEDEKHNRITSLYDPDTMQFHQHCLEMESQALQNLEDEVNNWIKYASADVEVAADGSEMTMEAYDKISAPLSLDSHKRFEALCKGREDFAIKLQDGIQMAKDRLQQRAEELKNYNPDDLLTHPTFWVNAPGWCNTYRVGAPSLSSEKLTIVDYGNRSKNLSKLEGSTLTSQRLYMDEMLSTKQHPVLATATCRIQLQVQADVTFDPRKPIEDEEHLRGVTYKLYASYEANNIFLRLSPNTVRYPEGVAATKQYAELTVQMEALEQALKSSPVIANVSDVWEKRFQFWMHYLALKQQACEATFTSKYQKLLQKLRHAAKLDVDTSDKKENGDSGGKAGGRKGSKSGKPSKPKPKSEDTPPPTKRAKTAPTTS